MDNLLMKSGLTEDSIRLMEKVFENHSKIDAVILFGSRAKGNFRNGSDIDLALKGERLSNDDILVLGIQLDDLNLPYKIDLLNYHTINEAALVEHIDRAGVVFYERWKEVKILDIGKVVTGKTPSSKFPEEFGIDIPFVTPTDYKNYNKWCISAERGLSNKGIQKLKNSILTENSVLVTCIGSDMGRVAINKVPVVTNQQINSIIPNSHLINPDFCYYIMRSLYGTLKMMGSDGTAVPILNKSDFEKIKIIIPPLKEQNIIASTLNSLDDKIDLLQRQNKTLKELAETIFKKWFIEDASEEWEAGVLGDVIELLYGKPLKEEIRTGSGFPVIGSSGVVGYHREYLIESPGIVIGRKGTLGKVLYQFENFHPIDTTYFIRSKINSQGLFYEYFLLRSLNFAEMNSDSAVPGLNRDIALSTEIIVPPIKIINEFNEIIGPIFNKIQTNQIHVSSVIKLRDSLLPKLMSGEIRIKA